MADPTLQRAQAAALRLVFAPDAESARAVSAAIRSFLAEQGLAERELFSYELCIAEACNNAIEYAQGPEREIKPIAEALFTVTQIEMRVTDHTPGFVLPERVEPPSPQSERGRGLFIIKSVMDEVCYLRGTRENTLVMRKKRAAIPQARPPPAPAVEPPGLAEAKRELSACQNEEVRNRVLARELEIARDIQHLLLPRKLPQLAGFGLAGGWHSAREVGGDFYDAMALGGQSLLLMIADVMGKGVPAALFATTMRGALRGLAVRSEGPAQLLSGLNRLLYAELSAVGMFITAQVAHVDLRTRQVTAASAGHCPPLFITPGRRTVAAMPTQGVPLGVLPDTEYRNETATLGKPAMLLLHTDGLTDVRNPDGKMFGQQRLMAWLRVNSLPGRRAAELRDRLANELNRFRDGAAMADDQAFLLLAEESPGAGRAADAHVHRLRFQPGSFLFSSDT